MRELLNKYLKGELSAEDSKQVEEWYASFDKAGTPLSAFSTEEEEQETYAGILSNIHHTLQIQPAEEITNPTLLRKLYTNNIIKIAAVVTTLFVSAALFFYLNNTRSGTAEQMTYVVVAPGKMKLIELADGTRIWLNSATKFGYPKQFSSKLREVTLLEGEAFFDVAHEKNRPFIVHSKGLNTQVLGTSFNIDAYNFSKCVKVSVATGKVGVSYGKKLIGFLTPNEEIQYKLLSNKSTRSIGNAAIMNSWRNGDIVLDYIDFESLKSILFNNYSYTLKSGKRDLSQLHFSATIKKSDAIEDVMKLLSSINQTKFSITNKIITMY
nr:FecR family protein [Pedobacter panaciterrae]